MAVQEHTPAPVMPSATVAGSFKPHFWFEIEDDRLDVALADKRRLAEHLNEHLTIFMDAASPEPIGFCIRRVSEFWAAIRGTGVEIQNHAEISFSDLLQNAALRSAVPFKAPQMLRILLQKIDTDFADSRVSPDDLLAGRVMTGALTATARASILEPVSG